MRIVTIRGFSDDVHRAVSLVEEIINKNISTHMHTAEMTDIGVFDELNSHSNSGISNDRNSQSNVSELVPSRISTSLLSTIMASNIDSLSKSSELTDTMMCPVEKVGEVIGWKGTIIKSLSQQTGCKIILSDDLNNCNHKIIEFRGLEDQISIAKSFIVEIISKSNKESRLKSDSKVISNQLPSNQVYQTSCNNNFIETEDTLESEIHKYQQVISLENVKFRQNKESLLKRIDSLCQDNSCQLIMQDKLLIVSSENQISLNKTIDSISKLIPISSVKATSKVNHTNNLPSAVSGASIETLDSLRSTSTLLDINDIIGDSDSLPEANATIVVPNSTNDDNSVTNEDINTVYEVVDYPLVKSNIFIGYRGSMLVQQLSARTRTKILVINGSPGNSTSTRRLVVSGLPVDVSFAKQLIENVATKSLSHTQSLSEIVGSDKWKKSPLPSSESSPSRSSVSYNGVGSDSMRNVHNKFVHTLGIHGDGHSSEISDECNLNTSIYDNNHSKVAKLDRTINGDATLSNQFINIQLKSKDSYLETGDDKIIDDDDEDTNIVHHSIECPNEKVGLIIGSKGIVIKSMMGRSKAKIIVTSNTVSGKTVRHVEITGTEKQVKAAINMVECVIEHGNEALDQSGEASLGLGIITKHIYLSIDQIKNIVGHKGATMRKIYNDSSASIAISRSTTNSDSTSTRQVTVKGTLREVERALQLIEEISLNPLAHDDKTLGYENNDYDSSDDVKFSHHGRAKSVNHSPARRTLTKRFPVSDQSLNQKSKDDSNFSVFGDVNDLLSSYDDNDYETDTRHSPTYSSAYSSPIHPSSSRNNASGDNISNVSHYSSKLSNSPSKILASSPIRKLSSSPITAYTSSPNVSAAGVSVIKCPIGKVGILIGVKGSNIKEIMKRTNTSIIVGDSQSATSGFEYRDVTIRGKESCVTEAEKLITSLLELGAKALNK